MNIRMIALCSLIAAGGVSLHAESTEQLEASANATVQPRGIRTGSNGLAFFNVEGVSFGNNTSFGLAEFNFGGFASIMETVDSITSLELTFTQSNAAFTANGSLAFFIVTDTNVSMAQSGSPLIYDSSDATYGLGTQLGQSFLLGTGSFEQVASGDADTYTFSLSGQAQAYVKTQLLNGATFRIAITPNGDPGVAATWAGTTNFNYAGPTIKLDYTVVPEPSAALLGVVGMLTLGGLRRQRRMPALA